MSENTMRPLFMNARGEASNSGMSWGAEDWLIAVLGELGEASNILTFDRVKDDGLFDTELVVCIHRVLYCLGRLADCCGISLDAAVKMSFDMKSRQLDLPLFIINGGLK